MDFSKAAMLASVSEICSFNEEMVASQSATFSALVASRACCFSSRFEMRVSISPTMVSYLVLAATFNWIIESMVFPNLSLSI